jgi:CO/xanthine dehydrogenase Mo-binding subunit
MSGNAVHDAAAALRDQVLGAVAADRGEPVESLRFSAGAVTGPGLRLPVPEALALCRRRNVPTEALGTFFGPKGAVPPWASTEPGGLGQPGGPAGGRPERMARGGVLGGRPPRASTVLRSDRVFPDFAFGTHLCNVEVDLDTGQVTVLRYIAAHDVGRAINPLSVEGQISGAVIQGLGMALLEEVVLDEGVNLTAGFFQYLVPTATDVPDVEVIVLESGEGMGPFGARGIGEPPIGPPLAAVANAIRDAVGARPTTLPITPERVLACLPPHPAGGRSCPPSTRP